LATGTTTLGRRSFSIDRQHEQPRRACCGLLAAIRASWGGSSVCDAVGTQGQHFTLAYGHATPTRPKFQLISLQFTTLFNPTFPLFEQQNRPQPSPKRSGKVLHPKSNPQKNQTKERCRFFCRPLHWPANRPNCAEASGSAHL
ncbi:MAG: hypothetical protein RIS47_931, partial [Bacteroidota bacterium]